MEVALATPIGLKSFGGAERKLLEAAEMLVEEGNEVSIYTLSYDHPGRKVKIDEIIRSLKHLGVEYYEAKRHRVIADVAYVVYAPIVWRKFELCCPAIAGLHSPLLTPSSDALTTFINPYLTIKRYGSLRYSATFWLSNTIKNLDLSKFSAVRVLNKVFKVRHPHTYYIPEWVDCDVFKPLSNSRDDRFTVFFSGRHHWEKGFDAFLKVAAAVKKRGFDLRFLCTGESVDSVEGAGFLDDERLAATYSRSHVVLYPSRMDMFSGVIAEASACGTPVITTPIPAHASVGLPLIYACNTKQFIDALIRIYHMWREHPSQFDTLARRHREQVLRYDANKIFPKFENMLKEATLTYELL